MRSMQKVLTEKIEAAAIVAGCEVAESNEWPNRGYWYFRRGNTTPFACYFDFSPTYVQIKSLNGGEVLAHAAFDDDSSIAKLVTFFTNTLMK